MGEGLLYIRDWPGMLLLLSMATLVNFMIWPAMSLLPLLVSKHFGGEALQLGWINSAWGIGLIAGGVILSAWGGFRKRIVTSMSGTIGMGIGFALIGLTPANAFWPAVGAMVLAGATNSITNGPINALLQSVIPPDMQGRVFMIVGSLSGLASPLGLAVAGPVADWLGSGAWFVAGGVTTTLMGLASFFVPAIMTLEEQQAAALPEATAASAPAPTGIDIQT